jgi:protein TonB
MTLGSDIVVLDPPAPIGVAAPAVALPGEATSTPPPVILPAAGEPQASPDLSLVPTGVTVATASPGRLRMISTAIASVALHGVLVAGFLAFAAPSPPRHDVPAIEIEMVEPEAEPPPAAATPQEVAATETPPVDIEPPPLAEMPLPPELQPPAPVAEEPQPIALPPPPEPEATLPDDLRPPPVAVVVEPPPVVIEPPPLAELPLPAELRPPPPRQIAETRPRPEPRREVRRPPPPRRQEMARDVPRRPQAPRPATPPSAASAGRGVTSRPSTRTSSPPPTYLARVMAQLHRAKPAGSGQQGRAVVRFAIQRSGAAGGVSLAASSGNAAIDQAALSMVRRAAPFPPLPAEYGPATMALTVPIAFR